MPGDAERPAANTDFLQQLKDVFRHSCGQINRAVFVEDFDAADAGAVELSFIGDGTDDIAGFNGVSMSDFEPKSFHGLIAAKCWSWSIATVV